MKRAARWLGAHGVTIPYKDGEVDAVIEISPLTALSTEDLAGTDLPSQIEPGEVVLL